MITHSSNARLEDDLRLIAEYKPQIVITALGSPKPVMDIVKGYSVSTVIADVVNLRLAHKAAAAGVDGMAWCRRAQADTRATCRPSRSPLPCASSSTG